MLVLIRKRGESIRIGQDITLVVVEIRGDRVRLGIDAPPAVPVVRSELGELRRAAQYPPQRPDISGN